MTAAPGAAPVRRRRKPVSIRRCEPAQRRRPGAQAARPLRHEPEEPGRRPARRRPVHARPVPEGGRRAAGRPAARPRRHRVQEGQGRRLADGRHRAGLATTGTSTARFSSPTTATSCSSARTTHGRPVMRESYRLAPTEKAFWERPPPTPPRWSTATATASSTTCSACMLHAAPLTDPKDVAWFLASYARDATARIDRRRPAALATVRKALEEALGLTFDGQPRATTSSAPRWCRRSSTASSPPGCLWHRTAPGRRRALRLGEGAPVPARPDPAQAVPRVGRPEQLDDWRAGQKCSTGRPASSTAWTAPPSSPSSRTPRPSSTSTSRSWKRSTRSCASSWASGTRRRRSSATWWPAWMPCCATDLGRPDGLADAGVYVLDPCCGTGAYLVEVLRHDRRPRCDDKGEDALLGGTLKTGGHGAAVRLRDPAGPVRGRPPANRAVPPEPRACRWTRRKKERAGVYLTNALTGWEPPKGPKQQLMFPEMEEERDKADGGQAEAARSWWCSATRRTTASPASAVNEERDLSDAYRTTRATADLKPQGQGLNDLYVRFFRMAERCIVERTPSTASSASSPTTRGWTACRSRLMRRALPGGVRPDLDRLPQRRQVQDRQADAGRPARPERVLAPSRTAKASRSARPSRLLVRKPSPQQSGGGALPRPVGADASERTCWLSLDGFAPRRYERLTPARPLGLPFRPMGPEESISHGRC